MTGGWGAPRANPNRTRLDHPGDINEGPESIYPEAKTSNATALELADAPDDDD